MLTGTETRPKEMVAVPIERAGMGWEEKVGAHQPVSAGRHKHFLR